MMNCSVPHSRWVRWTFCLFAAWLAAGCISVNVAPESLEEANWQSQSVPMTQPASMDAYLEPTTEEYTIGPGDRISVDVAGVPELSRRALLVRPDGCITLFLVEDVKVTGLTPEGVARLLEGEYAQYLSKPDVVVTVEETRSHRFYVLGAVTAPGVYPIDGPMTVLEALALCGGSSRGDGGQIAADLKRGYVLRGSQVLPIRFEQLVSGDRSQNIYVRANDLLYLPARYRGEVTVLGEVQAPRTIPHNGELTLMSAIAQAGWVTDKGLRKEVRVVRGALTEPVVYLIDIEQIAAGNMRDAMLMPGDIVYVTTTAMSDWNEIIAEILPTLQAALTARFILDGIVTFPPGN